MEIERNAPAPVDIGTAGSSPQASDLIVQPLSPTSWRVYDSRLPKDDIRRLLGFIEEKPDNFEVTQLDRGFAWFSFETLVDAIDHFTHERPVESLRRSHVLSWAGRGA